MKNQSSIDMPMDIPLDCIKVKQPIGEFFIASIPAKLLCSITYADVRRLEKENRDVETYLGIQRPLNAKRVAEIAEYVKTSDACFPTSVILAVEARCASYDPEARRLTLSTFFDDDDFTQSRNQIQIAKVLDGQHRIDGLRSLPAGIDFDVNVSIFVEMDIENQAYIFSTVNLAQTKVSKSLVYDLFEYARSRSPQKTCHNVAVGLDSLKRSPFNARIKRLGTATAGRFGETLTQATVVENLLPYITADALKDRQMYINGDKPKRATPAELLATPFRNMFLEERDLDIADILLFYFLAVRQRWSMAWDSDEKGWMLNRTNGFRALMRFLRPVYKSLVQPGEVPTQAQFFHILEKMSLKDEDFTVQNFEPGTGGETKLFKRLCEEAGLTA